MGGAVEGEADGGREKTKLLRAEVKLKRHDLETTKIYIVITVSTLPDPRLSL